MGNSESAGNPIIVSYDGNFIAYTSRATNMVAGQRWAKHPSGIQLRKKHGNQHDGQPCERLDFYGRQHKRFPSLR